MGKSLSYYSTSELVFFARTSRESKDFFFGAAREKGSRERGATLCERTDTNARARIDARPPASIVQSLPLVSEPASDPGIDRVVESPVRSRNSLNHGGGRAPADGCGAEAPV